MMQLKESGKQVSIRGTSLVWMENVTLRTNTTKSKI